MPRKFDEDVEKAVISQVLGSEFPTGKANSDALIADYETYLDMLDSIRGDKEYDWMSNISIPEFASAMLTQSALDVGQYFQVRDFTEVYLQDESDQAVAASKAAKECINRTLNKRHLHHYQKFVRGKLINHLIGHVYLRCWWEQKIERVFKERRPIMEDQFIDDGFGTPVIDEVGQPAVQQVDTGETEDIFADEAKIDRFNYDVMDPRNVFTSSEYVYSLQDKKWVILRFEKTIEELRADEETMGYFNLDRLEDAPDSRQTDTAQESYNKAENKTKEGSSVSKEYDVLERYGKYWALIKKTDGVTGETLEVEPGLGSDGKPKEKAVFIEVILTFATDGNTQELIRFQPQPYVDASGSPFRPIIRGLCYVHPSEDGGGGDGAYARDLQTGINDTFNLGLDRTRLAALPVLKGKNIEDNPTIRFEPLHVMNLEGAQEVEEFRLSDDPNGVLQQIAMLTGKLQQVSSLDAAAQGRLPTKSSTSATAVATASDRTDVRTNYKSMTYEYTCLSEMYWMILQMTFRFAKPETGVELMGERVVDFDPTKEFFYKPVSSSIQTDQSKTQKINQWNTTLQIVAQTQHPQSVKAFNLIMAEIFELMGKDQLNVSKQFLDEGVPIQQGGPQQQAAEGGQPATNQSGLPQSGQEVATRGAASAGFQ